jgi:hypothetical protein
MNNPPLGSSEFWKKKTQRLTNVTRDAFVSNHKKVSEGETIMEWTSTTTSESGFVFQYANKNSISIIPTYPDKKPTPPVLDLTRDPVNIVAPPKAKKIPKTFNRYEEKSLQQRYLLHPKLQTPNLKSQKMKPKKNLSIARGPMSNDSRYGLKLRCKSD